MLSACSPFTEVQDASVDADTRDGAGPGLEGGTVDKGPGKQDLFAPGGSGAGPHGALPSGYCCTENSECRHRSCQPWNGGMMCMDHCFSDDGCMGSVAGLYCSKTGARCEPTSATASCTPAGTFSYGAKKTGACCFPTQNGWAGFECEGNHCSGFGPEPNPYICTQACTLNSHCPGFFVCAQPGYGYGVCMPETATTGYTCTD